VPHIEQISNLQSAIVADSAESRERLSVPRAPKRFLIRALKLKGVKVMLALIAAVLIVLWLLGFFAFHISAGVVHVLLIIGIVMLVLHFLRGRTATI
jgi:Family of unknown function (DUF5670)